MSTKELRKKKEKKLTEMKNYSQSKKIKKKRGSRKINQQENK